MDCYSARLRRDTGIINKSWAARLLSGCSKQMWALVAITLLAACAPMARGQANLQGKWKTLTTQMPTNPPLTLNPIHAALMHNGTILIVSCSGNNPSLIAFTAGIWDPSNNTVTPGPTQGWDMFCNGMIVLPDGRPFIIGGNLKYDPFFGWNRTSIYYPATGKYADMEDMAHGRWYPTAIVLGDGRVMTFSGLDENNATNTQVEIYKVGVGWSPPSAAPWTPPLYPRLHLMPNGKVFYSGSSTQSQTFDPATNTWSGTIATTNYGGTRTYGSSALFPLTPANGYKPKVMIFGGGNPATNTTEIIDLSAAPPAWVTGPNMSQARIEMNATMLPNGKILTVGGSVNDEDTATASLQADLYDTATNKMASAGSNAFPTLYHSMPLLLPDATVWVAGGNPSRGSVEPHVEIYTPPYLYNSSGTLATRPSITSVTPGVIGYGTSFQVQTPDVANIASVVIMKNGSVTHAFDMDQRLVGLSFTPGSGVLNVTGPPNGNIAPPGYYMIFLINTSGVPSVAKFVQVLNASTDTPPKGTITSPASDVVISPGQSVTFSGTGNVASCSITCYSWSFRGASPATSSLQNPGAVTFSNAGKYTVVFTVTDSAGNTDPSPPIRTITVSTQPAPLLSTVSPNVGGQGSNLNVTLSGNSFQSSPTCSFGSGITVNSCTYNSPNQITANINILGTTAVGSRNVTVTNTDGQSSTLTNGFTVQTGSSSGGISFGGGFTTGSMVLNGNAAISGNALSLTTTNGTFQASSAWYPTPVNIQNFTTDFSFQTSAGSPTADGLTFTLQNNSTAALGGAGGNLAYAAIANSIAVKFDLYSNALEGVDSTGLYLNGASPTTPAVDMTGSGIDLHSGDIFRVHMTYDGTNLVMTS